MLDNVEQFYILIPHYWFSNFIS